MKVGIFGGTFDPWTPAHEEIVRTVLAENLVDKVVIMPTAVNYYRTASDSWLRPSERIRILNRACKYLEHKVGAGKVMLDCRELQNAEGLLDNVHQLFCKSRRYIHSLIEFQMKYPKHELYTIIGTDQFDSFKQWFMWREILTVSPLIVVQGRNSTFVNSDIPHTDVIIDKSFKDMSATEIRNKYKSIANKNEAIEQYLAEYFEKEKILNRTPIFTLVEKPEVQPGFKPVGINAPDWVTIVVRDKDKFLMVKQLRYGIMQDVLEFPCGQVEDEENPIDAAHRELKEETGLDDIELQGALQKIGTCYTNPAFMNNRMHFYYVNVSDRDVKLGEQHLDQHERISVSWVPISNINNLYSNSEVTLPAFMRIAYELASEHDDLAS